QLGALGLGALAIGDVSQDGQVAARHEPRRRAVLHMARFAVGANQLDLATVLAGAEKRLPFGLETGRGREKVVEPAAAELRRRQPEQSASGGVGLDERARVVDDEHGVKSGSEQGFGVSFSGQRRYDITPVELSVPRSGAGARAGAALARGPQM